MVTEAVNLAGGFNGIIQNGDTVVIKPNLVLGEIATGTLPPQVNGITTDYRVIKAIVELVRDINPNGTVYVMEGSANPTRPIMTSQLYDHSHIPGVDDFLAIEEDSGAWMDYNSPGLVQVSLPDGRLNTSYYMNRKYYEADVLISVPTLKNHSSACVTGGLKNCGIGGTPGNIYGTSSTDPLRLDMVSHFTTDLHAWIHDWYLCRPIDFVITDGLQGLQNGPGHYDLVNLGAEQMNMRLILAGTDAVAVDTIQSLIIGWDPESVAHLTYLNESSQGNIDTSCITVVGEKVMDVKESFEGSIPYAGGSRISDNSPPSLSVTSSDFSNGTCNLSLSVASETVKVEVYIDGNLRDPVVTGNFTSINMDISDLPSGDYVADMYAYDRFLNYSSTSIPFTTSTGGTPVPTSAPGNLGDVNGDGNIDIVDALLTAQYYVGLNPDGFDPAQADVNCDEGIDIVDALLIAQYYVGLVSEFC